jgi:hypothetical protein
MQKTTTTKATHLGYQIIVLSDVGDNGTIFACTNDTGRQKNLQQWFPSQGEAIANERREIDIALQMGYHKR